jgi:long-chain acyl-CoA synthetase
MMPVNEIEQRLIGIDSPYEIREVIEDGVSHRIFRHAPQSLNDIFRRAVKMGGTPFATFGSERMTYGQAFEEAGRVAMVLRERFGVGSGVRVGLALDNRPEWISAFFAIISLGATAVLIAQKDPAQIHHCVLESRCLLLLVDVPTLETISPMDTAFPLIVVGLQGTKLSSSNDRFYLDQLIRETVGTCTDFGSLPSLPPNRECVIAFTSGTTGKPKGVVLTHLNIISGLMNMALGGLLAHALNGDVARRRPAGRRIPCALVHLPMSYIGGFSPLLLTLMVGGRLVILHRWDLDDVSRLIEIEQVTSLPGCDPAQLRELLQINVDAASLTSIGVSGVALHKELLHELATRWPHVVVGTGYGMTETSGSIAVIAGQALMERPQSSGRVLPTVDIRIVGDDNMSVAPGCEGEIWLRSASLMRGYCTASESPHGLIDGWFRTGDLGVLSEDRHLSIVDRLADAFTIDSTRVSALELERALVNDPRIVEAAVFKRNKQSHDSILIVVVVPRLPNLIDTASIQSTVTSISLIPASKVNVLYVSTLPRNRFGKVDRAALRLQTATDY